MEVLLHGRLADRAGRRLAVSAPADGASVAELRQLIAAQIPELAEEIRRERVRACVGEDIVPDSFRPSPGQAVEFLPPVSGG